MFAQKNESGWVYVEKLGTFRYVGLTSKYIYKYERLEFEIFGVVVRSCIPLLVAHAANCKGQPQFCDTMKLLNVTNWKQQR